MVGRGQRGVNIYELSENTVMGEALFILVPVSKSLWRRLQFEVCHLRRII